MRKILYFIFIMGIILLVSGCGVPSPPNESHIKEDLSLGEMTLLSIENPLTGYAYSYDLDVKSVQIERRQTNEKNDTVYCLVEEENEWYRFNKHLVLTYNYYDTGGWILDGYKESGDSSWEVIKSPFTASDVEVLQSMVEWDYPQVDEPQVEENLGAGTLKYTFPVRDYHSNGYYDGSVMQVLSFDGTTWSLETENAISFVWTINNTTWNYHRETPKPWSSVYDVSVDVTEIDANTSSFFGHWIVSIDDSMYSHLRGYGFNSALPNDSTSITFSRAKIEIAYHVMGRTGREYYVVTFTPDEVKIDASYVGHYELTMVTANQNGENLSSLSDLKSNPAFRELVDRYFEVMEMDDYDLFESTFQNCLGDDIAVAGEHLSSYTGTILWLYSELDEERQAQWRDIWEDEFLYHTGLPLPEDSSEAHVYAEFESGNTARYNFIFSCKSGVWDILYIDDYRESFV